MEQVAEVLKMIKAHSSESEWELIVAEIEEGTRSDIYCFPSEIEAVLNAIISIYG